MHVHPVSSGVSATPGGPVHGGGVHAHGRAPATQAAPPAFAADSVASFLASGKIADLLAGIDQRRPIQSPEVIAELMRAAVSASQEQDFVRALEKLREIVSMDPERAEDLESEPALESMRTQISQLLRELAAGARSDAEQKLANAEQALTSDGGKLNQADQADLRTLLVVAGQLLETGRHASYVRAGDLAEVVMVQCGWTVAGVPVWVPDEIIVPEQAAAAKWKTWWQRAPLPILLLAWLAVGIAGALPFAVIHVGWPAAAISMALWGTGGIVFIRWYRRARLARKRLLAVNQAAATRKAT